MLFNSLNDPRQWVLIQPFNKWKDRGTERRWEFPRSQVKWGGHTQLGWQSLPGYISAPRLHSAESGPRPGSLLSLLSATLISLSFHCHSFRTSSGSAPRRYIRHGSCPWAADSLVVGQGAVSKWILNNFTLISVTSLMKHRAQKSILVPAPEHTDAYMLQ